MGRRKITAPTNENVLVLLDYARGKNVYEIAKKYDVSVSAITNQLARMRKRVGANNNAHAVFRYFGNGD